MRFREMGRDVGWQTSLRGFNADCEKTICTLEQSGESKAVETDIVIGADGARSQVRKSLGFAFDGKTEPACATLSGSMCSGSQKRKPGK